MEKHSGFNGPCKIPAVPGYIYIYAHGWEKLTAGVAMA